MTDSMTVERSNTQQSTISNHKAPGTKVTPAMTISNLGHAISSKMKGTKNEIEKVEREIAFLEEIAENPITWYDPPVLDHHKSPLQRFREACHEIVEHQFVQIFVTLMIVSDLVLTIHSFVVPEEERGGIGFYIANFVIIMVLTVDVVLRIIVDGLSFFKKIMDIIEVLVVVICLVFFFLESGPQGVSLGRTLRPLFRVIKALRLVSKAAVGQAKIRAKMNKLIYNVVHSFVDSQLEGLVYLPKSHLTVKPSDGVLYVQKAHVVSSAFDALHLPFTLKGGLLEIFRVDLGLERKSNELPGFEITLQNLLLVIGPGHHQVPPKPPWNYETVASAKTRMVDVLTHKLEAQMQDQKTSKEKKGKKEKESDKKDGEGEVEQKEQKGLMAAFIKRLKNGLKAALFARISVKVKNVVIRYEDDCELQGQRMLGIFKVGEVKLLLVDAAASDSEGHKNFQGSRSDGTWRIFSEEEKHYEAPSDEVQGQMEGQMDISRVSVWWGIDVELQQHYSSELKDAASIQGVAFRFKHEDLKDRVIVTCMQKIARPFGPWRRAWSYGYLVQPLNASVHLALHKPPDDDNSAEASTNFWRPAQDIDVQIQVVNISIQRNTFSSLINLVRFTDEWKKDDEKFQWRPRDTPGANTERNLRIWNGKSCWWPYTLWSLQRHVGGQLPWKLLPLLDEKRKYLYRRAYRDLFLFKLESVTPDELDNGTRGCFGRKKGDQGAVTQKWMAHHEEQMVEMMVALPIPELVRGRSQAYEIYFQHLEEENDGRKSSKDVDGHMQAIAHSLEEELEEEFGIDLDGDGNVGGHEEEDSDEGDLDLELGSPRGEEKTKGGYKRKNSRAFSKDGPPDQALEQKMNSQNALQFKLLLEYVSICFKKIPEDSPNIWDSVDVARFTIRGVEILFCKEAPMRIQLEMVPNLWDEIAADESGLNTSQKDSVESMLEVNRPVEWICGVLAPFGVEKSNIISYLQNRKATTASGWLGLHLAIDTIMAIDCTAPSSAKYGRKLLACERKGGEPIVKLKLKKSPNLEFLNTQQDLTWSLAVETQPIKLQILQSIILVLKELTEVHKPEEIEHHWHEIELMRAHLQPKFQEVMALRGAGKLFEALAGEPRQKWEILLAMGGIDCTFIAPFQHKRVVVQRVCIPAGRFETCRYGFAWPPPFLLGSWGNAERQDDDQGDSRAGSKESRDPLTLEAGMSLSLRPAVKLDESIPNDIQVQIQQNSNELSNARAVSSKRHFCLLLQCPLRIKDGEDGSNGNVQPERIVTEDHKVYTIEPIKEPIKEAADQGSFDPEEDYARFWRAEECDQYRWSSLPTQVEMRVVDTESLGLLGSPIDIAWTTGGYLIPWSAGPIADQSQGDAPKRQQSSLW